jgi:hypothetical protein
MIEFVPVSHQYLLTVLSIWWAVGQLIGSLVGIQMLWIFSLPSSFLHYRLLGHYWETSLVHSLLELSVYHLKIKDGVISSIRWEVS